MRQVKCLEERGNNPNGSSGWCAHANENFIPTVPPQRAFSTLYTSRIRHLLLISQRVATEWHKKIAGGERVGIKFPISFGIDARALTIHS